MDLTEHLSMQQHKQREQSTPSSSSSSSQHQHQQQQHQQQQQQQQSHIQSQPTMIQLQPPIEHHLPQLPPPIEAATTIGMIFKFLFLYYFINLRVFNIF